MERRTVETIKGDTHDAGAVHGALDELRHRLQPGGEKRGAGHEPADLDETALEVRDDDADGI